MYLTSLQIQDIGGAVPVNVVIKDSIPFYCETGPPFTTNLAECMRLHLGDVVEFLTDFHTLSKMKVNFYFHVSFYCTQLHRFFQSYCKGTAVGLNEDTLGGIIKAALAQYLALEITKGNGRDIRNVIKYFPWLYSNSSIQQS